MSSTRIWPFRNPLAWGVLFVMALLLPVSCSKAGEEGQSDTGTAMPVRGEVASKPASGAQRADTGSGASDGAVFGTAVPPEDFNRKIVKTAELGVTSGNVRSEATAAEQVATRFGGTIISSQTYRSDNAVYADLILSVPSEHFEDALGELRGLGKEVTTDNVSGQDVTEEYVDLQSRERNLLAAEQSLLDLYNRAGDVQDALSIQRELTTVRGQIEQVQGRMKYLEQSSDMARISLNIQPVTNPPKPPPAWDPTVVMSRAWNASLSVLQALSAAILSTLVFGWWIIPPLALGAWWLRRRRPAPQPPE